MVLLVNPYDEDGPIIPVTDDIQFAGVKQKTFTNKNKLSSQEVRFFVSFAVFVNRKVSPTENWT